MWSVSLMIRVGHTVLYLLQSAVLRERCRSRLTSIPPSTLRRTLAGLRKAAGVSKCTAFSQRRIFSIHQLTIRNLQTRVSSSRISPYLFTTCPMRQVPWGCRRIGMAQTIGRRNGWDEHRVLSRKVTPAVRSGNKGWCSGVHTCGEFDAPSVQTMIEQERAGCRLGCRVDEGTEEKAKGCAHSSSLQARKEEARWRLIGPAPAACQRRVLEKLARISPCPSSTLTSCSCARRAWCRAEYARKRFGSTQHWAGRGPGASGVGRNGYSQLEILPAGVLMERLSVRVLSLVCVLNPLLENASAYPRIL